ncbi:MAG: transglutaminase domain-containing protein [Halioglobus sp.]
MLFPCRIIILILIVLITACSTTGVDRVYAPVTRDQLLDGSLIGLGDPDLQELPNIIAINEEMRSFLDQHVEPEWGSLQKVQTILSAMLDDGLSLDYDAFETHTAEEAFYIREANCMSFTNLFVALARASGVSAQFQEVDVPTTWEEQGNSWLYNRHVNAVVDLAGTSVMVDFAVDVVETDHRRRVMRDQEAQARYHSNMGVHYLSAGDYDQSFRHLRQALLLEPRTSFFWTNLGALYRRLKIFDAAEESFLIAVNRSSEPAAISSLARLYNDIGQYELAEVYEGKAQVFRRKNPYYLFSLAQQSFDDGDYSAAARQARMAANRKEEEPRFYSLMGLSYLKLGDVAGAKEQFSMAAELTENERERATFNRKLDLLGER